MITIVASFPVVLRLHQAHTSWVGDGEEDWLYASVIMGGGHRLMDAQSHCCIA